MAAEIALDRPCIVRIEDGRGCRVHVRRGLVWLTRHRCTEDSFLGPGERVRLDRNGLTLISALRPSLLTIVSPASAERAGVVRLADGEGGHETVMSWPPRAAPSKVGKVIATLRRLRQDTTP
jgi:hypothetical protein